MKRQRSYGEDLEAIGDKNTCKDWGRRDQESDRSSSHRRFYPKAENGRKGSISASVYDRSLDDERDASRLSRKRFDHDIDAFDRRKGFDRYRDSGDRVASSSSPRNIYGTERIHRSESFSSSRREFPKGFRSERDRHRRDDGSSSWRRISMNRDSDDDLRFGAERANRASEERGSVRSPPVLKDAVKSPPWSKDSSGERSRSVETKKSEETQGESGNSSEMEEGELEPESDPEPEPEPEPESGPRLEAKLEADPEPGAGSRPENEPEQSSAPNSDMPGAVKHETSYQLDIHINGQIEAGDGENLDNSNDKLGTCETKPDDDTSEKVAVEAELGRPLDESEGSADGTRGEEVLKDNVSKVKEETFQEKHPSLLSTEESEMANAKAVEKHLTVEEQQKESKGIDLELRAEEIDVPGVNKESVDGKTVPLVGGGYTTVTVNGNAAKDKGKGLALTPSNEDHFAEDRGRMAREAMAGKEDNMEGPSSSGLKLFFTSDFEQPVKSNSSSVKKTEDKLKLEPLELSLGLPSMSVGPQDCPKQTPQSPGRGRSLHSLPTSTFRTDSDGFTASMSFSGSQTFVHYPSCSLTQNSCENYEQSVGSHPIFHGMDQVSHGNGSWQAQSLNDAKQRDMPLYQRILQNGNGALHTSQASQGILNGQSRSTGIPTLDRQASLQRQTSVQLRQEVGRSPSQSVGSHDTWSEHSKERKRVVRERNAGGVLFRSSQGEEQMVVSGPGVAERVVAKIVSDPLHITARLIQEMGDQPIAYLRESASAIVQNEAKLHPMQELLKRRSDLTPETLNKCHQTQLEILVALRTGLGEFLRRANSIPLSDLVDIFLNLKCRNLTCLSILPVDECDCKVCSQKTGFCSACMCVVCSKFDMASNTCSWVGCDICVHWCHTDCALRGSYIRNGRSVTGSHGATEMQFFCVACGHPSEMFGFVKDVFRTCAKDWKSETLCKELEYVRRIFYGSEDARGKQLHDLAIRMLSKLENKSNLPEVYACINAFLSESDSKCNKAPPMSVKEPQTHKNPGEGSNGIGASTQEPSWLKPSSSERGPARVESAAGTLPTLDWARVESRRPEGVPELQLTVEKKPVVDELESIVRIKHAEAKLFQARADDARREAEGLKRIAIAKNDKIEEEYANRITKLRLVEAEERRRQKLEELQVLERAHLDYLNMKVRMEADINDLLIKMEATKRNLST